MAAVVNVTYFGAAAEIAGKPTEEYLADDTLSLRKQVEDRYPMMKQISFRLALNKTLLNNDTILKDNDIVAILPPFSGG